MFRFDVGIHFVLFNFFKLIASDQSSHLINDNDDCDLNYKVNNFFEDVENIEEKYAQARNEFHELMGGRQFDENMIQVMLRQRGAAMRTIYSHGATSIPAALNLGEHVIIRLKRKVLMFYRMILKNNTVFQLDSIENDFENMTLNAELRLNELQLLGSYSSCVLRRKSKQAYDYFLNNCRHFGQLELLLSNVKYKLQGRYRLLQDKLKLEHIVSKLDIEHVGVNIPARRWSRRVTNNVEQETVWRSRLGMKISKIYTLMKTDFLESYRMEFKDFLNSLGWYRLHNNVD